MSFPRSAPSGEGVEAAGVERLLDALAAAPGVEMHSLMLLRHGRVLAEGWWAPYTADRVHLLYSLSKSFTATALGLAVAEGRLSLEDPVISFFPEFADEITDDRSRRMRVRDCAAMASGHAQDTIEEAIRLDPVDLVRGFLLTPPVADPGTLFAYNQPCTYTLSAIIQRVTGLGLLDYLSPRLLDPLGIEQAFWQEHPGGPELGFTGLHTTTESIARLGQLHLQQGRWRDQRILPAAWVAEATSTRVSNAAEPNPDWSQGYGFQFWTSRHGYRGDGAYGQFMVVLPEDDVVLATTGASLDMQAVLDAVWTHLLPAISSSAAPVGAPVAADAALAERLTHLRLPPYAAARGSVLTPHPGDPDRWSGRVFTTDGEVGESVAQLETVQLVWDDGWSLVLRAGAEVVVAAFAPATWLVTEAGALEPSGTSTGGSAGESGRSVVPVAASGGWVEGVLEVEVVFLETPHRLRLRLDEVAESLGADWHTEPLRARGLGDLGAPR